jgi:hypothetical protein
LFLDAGLSHVRFHRESIARDGDRCGRSSGRRRIHHRGGQQSRGPDFPPRAGSASSRFLCVCRVALRTAGALFPFTQTNNGGAHAFTSHVSPHFHATYGESEALLTIDTSTILRGTLPTRALRLGRDVDLSYLEDRGPIFEPLRDPEFFRERESRSWGAHRRVAERRRPRPLVLHGDYAPAGDKQTAQGSRGIARSCDLDTLIVRSRFPFAPRGRRALRRRARDDYCGFGSGVLARRATVSMASRCAVTRPPWSSTRWRM